VSCCSRWIEAGKLDAAESLARTAIKEAGENTTSAALCSLARALFAEDKYHEADTAAA
jgi:hypothetical protein